MSAPVRPVTLLIAALGGEGGGVLTSWIINAASELGLPAQSTSIPGVAQRTGATTYYIEILATPLAKLDGRRPILALSPGIGDIDVMVSSELLEAGRAISMGFVTPDRTLLIASTSRFYVMNEKVAMGDGRYDQKRLIDAAESNSKGRMLFDMEAVAKTSGAMINAVMLGAIAGCGKLPIPAEAFEAAIRADGKAVESNLRGFRAGLDAARAQVPASVRVDNKRAARTRADLETIEDEIRGNLPPAAHEILLEGVRRLIAFQDIAYARLYLKRLKPVAEADARAGRDGKLLREIARHLAVRMSFEDLIRVAQAKIDPKRFDRIATELAAKPGEPFKVVEFLKPGIEEMCQILPPSLARRIIDLSTRRNWIDRVYFPMHVKTTSINGFLRFWLLAKLRPWRPKTFRYHEEQKTIESWLALVLRAVAQSPELAGEIAECARLIKGYGSTHKRGVENFQLIETRVIAPALDGQLPLAQAVDAVASARAAALLDPEGEGLTRCLDEIESRSAFRVAAE